MWLQAVFTRDDLALLLAQWLPAQVRLGPPGSDRFLYLGRPTHVELVRDEGLRIQTRAKVRWDLLGVRVPLVIKSITLMLRPVVARKNRRDVLQLQASVEEADLAVTPGVVDRSIVGIANKQLEAQAENLSWDFVKTLSFHIPIPDVVTPVESFDLIARWGEVKVTAKALTFAVSFKTRTHRANRAADAA